jgi:hypothetical protein
MLAIWFLLLQLSNSGYDHVESCKYLDQVQNFLLLNSNLFQETLGLNQVNFLWLKKRSRIWGAFCARAIAEGCIVKLFLNNALKICTLQSLSIWEIWCSLISISEGCIRNFIRKKCPIKFVLLLFPPLYNWVIIYSSIFIFLLFVDHDEREVQEHWAQSYCWCP